MSEGWGEDFDEDGNVIGEVPESEPSFFAEHAGKILLIAALVFLINLPGAGDGGLGFLLGAAAGSLAISSVLVYAGIAIQNR